MVDAQKVMSNMLMNQSRRSSKR